MRFAFIKCHGSGNDFPLIDARGLTLGDAEWAAVARALAATGRTSEALDACDEQIDLARRFGVAREEGMALTVLGTITGDAERLHAAATVL